MSPETLVIEPCPLFCHHQLASFGSTNHWPLALFPRHSPLVTRHYLHWPLFSRPAPHAAGRKLGSFSGSIPLSFVLSHNMPTINTTSNWLRFGAFLSPPVPSPRIHWPLCFRPTPHQHGQVVHGPSPAGYCLLPTAELAKSERGPISTSGPPSISVCHRNRGFLGQKSTYSSPLAAARPWTTSSWPEALNASGSRRACQIAIRLNACSLLALPDLPGNSPK